MVTTRSSPRKRLVKATVAEEDIGEPVGDEELDEAIEPEDVNVKTSSTKEIKKSLGSGDSNPPKLFILPRGISREARIISLPSPVDGSSCRYLICPDKGSFEFTKVSTRKSDYRCSLLVPKRRATTTEHVESSQTLREASGVKGYLSQSSDVFMATPIDPVFLLLAILAPVSNKGQKRLFVPLDDHLDTAPPILQHLLKNHGLRRMFEMSLRNVCDTVEAGDDSMYRLSVDKLGTQFRQKAERMVKNGLPASMEEKFIRQALQPPLMSVKREDTITSAAEDSQPNTQAGAVTEDGKQPEELSETQTTTGNSQLSATRRLKSLSISGEQQQPLVDGNGITSGTEASPRIKHLLRMRTAMDFMQSSYIPKHLQEELNAAIDHLIDFSPLNAHLKQLEKLHEEARALRSMADTFTQKRGLDDDDDEAAEARAEKKRKKEEEEKRKKQETKAMKDLKKVDVKGMKKMSSFFQVVAKKKS